MAVLSFTVPDEWDGERLEHFLKREQHLSGTVIKRARQTENGLTMNGRHIRTIDPISAGAVVAVVVQDNLREYKTGGAFAKLLYADDDIAILDKPAGMPCHPSRGHPYDTLANAFSAHEEMRGKVFRPVGRLDKDTSGAVVCALHAHAAFALEGEGRPQKQYLAIVSPPPKAANGVIDAPIEREFEDSVRRCVREDGRRAVTHYQTLLCDGKIALLRLWLETGRTHQIRVHMAYIGSPLAGDALYGGAQLLGRHALHCGRIAFKNPVSGRKINVTSPLPKDMNDLLAEHFTIHEIAAATEI